MNFERLNEKELYDLMLAYKETTVILDIELHNLNAEINQLTEVRSILAKPYQEKLAEIEAQIRITMLDRKASFISVFGKVSFRKGAIRRTWNLESLDAVCNAKPEIKDAIWMFREEKIGDPQISIKLE
jgi:hypothetical protein